MTRLGQRNCESEASLLSQFYRQSLILHNLGVRFNSFDLRGIRIAEVTEHLGWVNIAVINLLEAPATVRRRISTVGSTGALSGVQDF